ncbi:unnamed protein product [Pleuronectes platessa]|uniref:Uncharacterized protein n=1 Tax=Pleuronectes platessa TaxID=8262 RepID=A0A9N7Y6K3_PLEPL|nr:unnamed protein product [Pleuronectes platessa]
MGRLRPGQGQAVRVKLHLSPAPTSLPDGQSGDPPPFPPHDTHPSIPGTTPLLSVTEYAITNRSAATLEQIGRHVLREWGGPHHKAMARAGLTSRRSAKGL